MTPSTYRVTYGKTRALRFLGHLDLARLWHRCMRRADLRLAFTAGYRPRPKVATGPPLSLGFTSRVEMLDVTLTQTPEPAAVQARLQAVAPPGLSITSVAAVTADTPKLSTIETLSYTATLPPTAPPPDRRRLADRVAALCAADTLPVTRRRKGRARCFDLRASLRTVALTADDQLRMHLAVTPAGTANPREVLALLATWDEAAIREAAIERCALSFASSTTQGFNGHTTPNPQADHNHHRHP